MANFPPRSGQMLAEVVQGGCGFSVLGDLQRPRAHSSLRPALGERAGAEGFAQRTSTGPFQPPLPCGSVLCFCPSRDLQGLCAPFCVALGLQCAGVWGQQGQACQRSSESVSKCVIVMDRICVCWPCVPGVMAFLSYLVICVVGFFVESAFFSFFFLCKVWMGAFGLCTKFLLVVFLLCCWMVVFFLS